jgi:phosphoglycolate phosphatase
MDNNKLIIFDMDGTLFRTETVDIEAFNNALVANGFSTLNNKEILSFIGVTLDEICRDLLKTEDNELIDKFRSDVISFEKTAIREFGLLYTGVEELLEKLKRNGYLLCICSNGNEEYITDICQKFNFNRYFSDIWYQREGISKSQAVGLLKQKFGVRDFIMVGDRSSDILAAKENSGISIGAGYGFGGDEIEAADYKAYNIDQVYEIIMSLSGI